MNKASKDKKKLENWKDKAIERGEENRYLRRENCRVRQNCAKYRKEARELEKKVKVLEAAAQAPVVKNKSDVVDLSLRLFKEAGIGFRAVSRVLRTMGTHLGLKNPPCPQTISNWVNRLSISRIQNCQPPPKAPSTPKDKSCQPPPEVPSTSKDIWMIDASIALGSGKILAVLALRADYHRKKSKAPGLKDVRCLAVGVSASWTGEGIADFLGRLIKAVGRPVSLLKDGGKDLAKAAKLLGEKGCDIPCIDDVSHIAANLLKHEYASDPAFETFMSACGKVSKKLKQTVLACLAPPKVSTKARFMNLHRLVTWADQLLKHSPRGRVKKGSLIEKLRENLDQLPFCKSFIQRFQRDAAPLLECQQILKTKGLSRQTLGECESAIAPIPQSSPIRVGFENWLKKQYVIAEEIGLNEQGMPVSTDSIESLFGVAKHLGTGDTKDANRIAGRIPAICGSITEEDAHNVLSVSVEQQQEAMGGLPSLVKQRRRVLPNPGTLESELTVDANQKFELMPGAKKRSKNSFKSINTGNCGVDKGPPIKAENKTNSCLDDQLPPFPAPA